MAPFFLHFLIQAKLRELGHFCYGAHTLLGPFSSVDHPTIKKRAEDALDNFAALIDQIGRVTGVRLTCWSIKEPPSFIRNQKETY